eukprot:358013-Chlamydomonas_euryale.AAC.1
MPPPSSLRTRRARPMKSAEPSSTEPTGQPRPLDRQTETVSKIWDSGRRTAVTNRLGLLSHDSIMPPHFTCRAGGRSMPYGKRSTAPTRSCQTVCARGGRGRGTEQRAPGLPAIL